MIDTRLDWSSFLGRHDLTWSVKPVSWDQGAFIGNGWLGAMVYGEEHRLKRNVLRFVLGRTDVTARRPEGGFSPRVPIGELHLELAGWIYQPTSMRLHLWDAELKAEITTTAGTVKLRAIAHSREMVMAVELETSAGEDSAAFRWYPYSEVDPILQNADGRNLNQYIPEEEVTRSDSNGIEIGLTAFKPEGTGGCATAWTEKESEGASEGFDRRRILYLSVMNGADESSADQASEAVSRACGQPWDAWVEQHRSWWHAYYPQSFLSIPDTQLEGFYWIQMYKLASATRSDGMIIDNQGPWLTSSPWPGVWFNMNVQMSYSPVYASNRLELGLSLVKAIRGQYDQLVMNVPEEYRQDSAGLGRSCSYDLVCPVDDEKGNLLWICHNLWRQYRYSMDSDLLKDLLFPLLRRAVRFHMRLLAEGDDGLLHLPPTISPEYGSFLQLTVPDAHYDLALLEWGIRVLLRVSEPSEHDGIATAAELDAERQEWTGTLERLAPLPVDETGYMIGRGQPLAFGHRHFSHMMAAFPLHTANMESKEERALIQRSLRHWFSREGDLRGFTFTGASSIAATIGLGDEAHAYLKSLLHILKPNTMYKEAGPVIESPLAGAEALHDMLLQSWGEWIRVFPALPGAWKEAAFHDLRAEGAFLVSAVRSRGKTSWIRVKSLAGMSCRLITDMTDSVSVTAGGGAKAIPLGDGRFELVLAEGEEIVLYEVDAAGNPALENGDRLPQVRPVAAEPHLCGYFGGFKPWRLYGIPIWTAD